MRNRASFVGTKWPGREADHSPTSTVVFKNLWSSTSTPQYTFMDCTVQMYLYTQPRFPFRLCSCN